MRTPLSLAVCLSIAPAIAQDPVDPPAPAAAAAARMQELQKLYQDAIATWRAALEKAREKAADAPAGAAVPAMAMSPDFGPVVAKARQFAAEFAGTDDAVPFLLFALQNARGDRDATRSAIGTLIEDHVDDPRLAQAGAMLPYLGDDALVQRAITGMLASRSAAVRGWALYARHKQAIEEADREGDAYRGAKQQLLAAVAAAEDERLGSEVRAAIDLREKFAVGDTAPDIEGVDLDGVAFKLSDYRGKVIFLDFWGDW